MPAEPLHNVEIRLSYGDCDPAGIVYYANYYRWMERAHTEWWFLRGLRFDELPRRFGVSLVTRSAHAEFERTTALFDLVECRLYAERLGRSSFEIRCDFITESGERACRSRLTLVALDPSGRPTALPEALRKELLDGGAAT